MGHYPLFGLLRFLHLCLEANETAIDVWSLPITREDAGEVRTGHGVIALAISPMSDLSLADQEKTRELTRLLDKATFPGE